MTSTSLLPMAAKNAGFDAAYLSGASLAYTRHGSPDIGLVTMTEVAETVSLIRERSEMPLIVDADTGYGNAISDNLCEVARRSQRREVIGGEASVCA